MLLGNSPNWYLGYSFETPTQVVYPYSIFPLITIESILKTAKASNTNNELKRLTLTKNKLSIIL